MIFLIFPETLLCRKIWINEKFELINHGFYTVTVSEFQ